MDWLSDFFATLKANAAAILTIMGAIVSGWFVLAGKRTDVSVDLRKLDAAERERHEKRFDAFLDRLEKEREEAQRENAELRGVIKEQTGHIQALTDRSNEQGREIGSLRQRVAELSERVATLIGFIRQQGHEPPPPPGHWPP